MRLAEIQKEIKNLLQPIPLLLWEMGLFILNLPRYLYQFLRGLRHFSKSYRGMLRALEESDMFEERLKTAKLDPATFRKEVRTWVNETIRLNTEHERMFTQLFGALVAILALLISILALMIGRQVASGG